MFSNTSGGSQPSKGFRACDGAELIFKINQVITDKHELVLRGNGDDFCTKKK